MERYIKKLLLLFILPLAVLVPTGCGDDEIGGEEDIVGTWQSTDSSFEFTVDGEDFFKWLAEFLELTDKEAKAFADGVEKEFLEGGGFEGTVTFNADNTYSANFDDDPDSGEWTLTGSTLTLDSTSPDEDDQTLKVLTLNSKTLVLEFSEEEDSDFDQDGTEEEFAIVIELTLKKQ